MKRIIVLCLFLAVSTCFPVAHTVHISPAIDPSHLEITSPYPISVGIFVNPDLLDRSVVDQGKYGRSYTYYPYLVLIRTSEEALPYLFNSVTTTGVLPPRRDRKMDIKGVIKPEIKASKGGEEINLPLQNALVEVHYTLYGLDGKTVWEDSCEGKGQRGLFSVRLADSFNAAFQNAVECIVRKMKDSREIMEWAAGTKKEEQQ